MEWKIGEIRQVNGEWYQCVEGTCNNECYFYNRSLHKTIADINGNGFGACNACFRNDNKSVIFKKLEKVGEPFIGKVHIQLQRYKIYVEPIVNPAENVGYVDEENLIAIEIKENKEDMEEKKLNLKPFDIKKAKEGCPVYTRDGRKVRIVCFDKIDARPILALVPSTDGKGEDVFDYFVSGKRIATPLESDLDLMMLPEKKEGWINISNCPDNGYSNYDSGVIVFKTKEEAVNFTNNKDYIDTVKVTWEE